MQKSRLLRKVFEICFSGCSHGRLGNNCPVIFLKNKNFRVLVKSSLASYVCLVADVNCSAKANLKSVQTMKNKITSALRVRLFPNNTFYK